MSQWPVLSGASLACPPPREVRAGGHREEGATRGQLEDPSIRALSPVESPGGAAAGSLGLAAIP